MADRSLPPDYFDALYAKDPDPWRFATSPYERAKYAATMAALGPWRFARALEVGCSIGVLTRQLARRCDALVSVDVAAAALAEARDRCAGLPVTFVRARMPDEWPPGDYDLIVLSEVLYYFAEDDLRRTAELAARDARGMVVLVHYIKPTDYPMQGDAAVAAFIRHAPGLRIVHGIRAAGYRLDVLRANGPDAAMR